MPRAHTQHARICALHTTLGPQLRRIDDELEALGGNAAQLERIKQTIGLNERRVAPPGITAADLGAHAARQIDGYAEADGLIFVTQSPDHFQPANAAILHGRLGLKSDCACFDVGLGCSGWVYGLYLASLMVEHGGCEKVLLVAADTLSQCVNPRDRAVAALFGDAGTATLIERSTRPCPMHFALHTDGSRWDSICQPAGGFRQPRSEQTAAVATDEDGNSRSLDDLHMDGAAVFTFSITEEPKAITEILAYAQTPIDAIDYIVFHQANRYIISNIARRLKLPPQKAPADTVAKYGNQSSASIPATLCDALANRLTSEELLLIFSGFGVGLSWGSALGRVGHLYHCALDIYPS